MALQEFISTFYDKGGPAFLNRFEVIITSPIETGNTNSDNRHTSFKVVSASMPGKNLRTVTNENVYGPTFEMAQGVTYAETISMNFYLSSEHFERTYFMNWMDMIYKPESYNLEYYDNYKRNIEIYQLDKNEQKTAGITLTECYPKTIGAIEYAQSSADVGQISVEFVFREHFHTDSSGKVINLNYKPILATQPLAQRGLTLSSFGGLDFDF